MLSAHSSSPCASAYVCKQLPAAITQLVFCFQHISSKCSTTTTNYSVVVRRSSSHAEKYSWFPMPRHSSTTTTSSTDDDGPAIITGRPTWTLHKTGCLCVGSRGLCIGNCCCRSEEVGWWCNRLTSFAPFRTFVFCSTRWGSRLKVRSAPICAARLSWAAQKPVCQRNYVMFWIFAAASYR